MSSRAALMATTLATTLATVACGSEPKAEIPRQAPPRRVKLQVSTEVSPVVDLKVVGAMAFATTDSGLERWDLTSGTVLTLSADQGLPGSRILGTAADASRGLLWIATEQGVGTYEVKTGVFTPLPPPPTQLSLVMDAPMALAAEPKGGVWVGHQRGLFYLQVNGGWVTTPVVGPVRDLFVQANGWLWIATPDGVIGRKPDGETLRYGPEHGLDVASPQSFAAAPQGGVIVTGDDSAGRPRVAARIDGQWASYRMLPEQRFHDLASDGTSTLALADGRIYRIGAPTDKKRRLARDGARLVPLSSGPAALGIEPIDVTIPADVVAMAAAPNELLLATRAIGIARVPKLVPGRAASPDPVAWLRRQVMFDDAQSLSVACSQPDDCWISVGARRGWHWHNDRFVAGGPDQVVLAVGRHPSGAVYALHRGNRADVILLSRVDESGWSEIPNIAIQTPGKTPDISFAEFSPGGQLWIGLRYHSGDETEPWGTAVVDIGGAKVQYHRATKSARERKAGQLPVPIAANGIAFVSDQEVWFATSQGAARLTPRRVDVWGESENLPSDLIRGVTVSGGGRVFAASGAGIGIFDGRSWSFPPTLAFPTNDVAVATNGILWMATDRGIANWDGRKVRRLDTRRGLVEDQLLDLALDHYGRVWARGPGSLVLLHP